MKKKLLLSLFTVTLSLAGFAQGSNGLVAHWDFNGTTNDVSGHGLNGSAVGTSYAPGYTGNTAKALYFQGYNIVTGQYDYVYIPYGSGLNLTDFSICAFIKPTQFNVANCQDIKIFERGVESQSDQYDLIMTDNAYDGSCSSSSPNNYVFVGGMSSSAPTTPTINYYSTNNIVLNNWYCVVATNIGDTFKLYVNGALVKTTYRPNSAPSTSTDGAAIGVSYNGQNGLYPYPFVGYMDDIRLYNRPLSAQEAGMYCDSVKMIPTAVAEIPENEELLLYPNPATKSITVQVPDNWKDVSYTLQSGMGQQVQAQKLTGKTNSIDMESLPAGIYMIRFTAGDKIITRKIVKQ